MTTYRLLKVDSASKGRSKETDDLTEAIRLIEQEGWSIGDHEHVYSAPWSAKCRLCGALNPDGHLAQMGSVSYPFESDMGRVKEYLGMKKINDGQGEYQFDDKNAPHELGIQMESSETVGEILDHVREATPPPAGYGYQSVCAQCGKTAFARVEGDYVNQSQHTIPKGWYDIQECPSPPYGVKPDTVRLCSATCLIHWGQEQYEKGR